MIVLLWEFWQAKKNYKKPKKSNWKLYNKSLVFIARLKDLQVDKSIQGSKTTLGNSKATKIV